MKNPYHILKVSQDATKKQIVKAFALLQKENVKTKKYTAQEIMIAQKQLLNPSKRLAADFMYPSKFKRKRPKKITINEFKENERTNINSINKNALDSLKFDIDYDD